MGVTGSNPAGVQGAGPAQEGSRTALLLNKVTKAVAIVSAASAASWETGTSRGPPACRSLCPPTGP